MCTTPNLEAIARSSALGFSFSFGLASLGPRVDAEVFDVAAELAAVAYRVLDGVRGPIDGE